MGIHIIVEVVLSGDKANESGITILFEGIDSLINPIMEISNHSILTNSSDKELFNALASLDMKLKVPDYPTSTENLCRALFNNIQEVGLPVIEVSLKETTSSEVRHIKQRKYTTN